MDDMDTEIPYANWPEENDNRLALQAYVNEEPYLFVGDDSTPTYTGLVSNFVKALNIPEDSVPRINVEGEEGVPALEMDGVYRVCGMGKAGIDTEIREASLYADSNPYKIGLDERHIEELGSKIGEWRLSIENSPEDDTFGSF